MSTNYKKALGKNAILKKITGLQDIKFKSKPARYLTDPESHKRKSADVEGEFAEDFEDQVIGGAVTGLAPYWNDLHDTYWVQEPDEGNRPILKELVQNIKIRFPDKHPEKPGQVILFADVDPTNFWDPFFQSVKLQDKQMVGGNYVFQLQKDPIDVLLYYSYANDHRTLIQGSTEAVSKYVVGQAKYKLIIPSQEIADDKQDLLSEIKTLALVGNMEFEKQKLIARIMKLRVTDYDTPDPDKLLVEVGTIAKSTKRSGKWDMTEQEKFIELATLSNEDLMIQVDITKGLEYRIITRERGDYFLNMEKMDAVIEENQLFTYFKADSNDKKYADLRFHIDEKEKK